MKIEEAYQFSTGKSQWSYRKMVFKRFRTNKRAFYSACLLAFFLLFYVFADFIANDKPLIARYHGRTIFPIVKSYMVQAGWSKWPEDLRSVNWKSLPYDYVVWPPIPYGPREQDKININVSPGANQIIKSWRWRHVMGTNEVGVDMTSAIIHASRIDLSIGVLAMAVAALIGLLMGSLAGYYGDDKLQLSRIRLWLNLLFLFVAWFYAFKVRAISIQDAATHSLFSLIVQVLLSMLIFSLIMLAANLLAFAFRKNAFLQKKIQLPVDITVSRLIEVIVSIPVIFLIVMVLAATGQGSIFWVMVVIGFTRWTGIARFVRAELLKIKKLEYIEAAQSLGYSHRRTLLKHALPNALPPVIVAIAFGIASAILIEAFLSFIGLGTAPEVPTWGRLLNEGSRNLSAWWLALFPGLAIFLTITIFNLIGEGLSDAMDPKQIPD